MATPITKEVALKAIEGREQVHCFLGQSALFIGADWGHDQVAELIEQAAKENEVHIAEHPIGHNLAVWCERSKTYAYFDVKRADLERLNRN